MEAVCSRIPFSTFTSMRYLLVDPYPKENWGWLQSHPVCASGVTIPLMSWSLCCDWAKRPGCLKVIKSKDDSLLEYKGVWRQLIYGVFWEGVIGERNVSHRAWSRVILRSWPAEDARSCHNSMSKEVDKARTSWGKNQKCQYITNRSKKSGADALGRRWTRKAS